MRLWHQFIRPTSIGAALQALASAPRPIYLIAGGTDLLLDIEQGRRPPATTLVDLTSIPELAVIEQRGDHVFLGAAAHLNRIIQDSDVQHNGQALVEACRRIGAPSLRNVATLGGNVAHALPAADGSIALLALDAAVEVESLEGRRIVDIGDLFRGPGQSALVASKEIIVGFRIPIASKREGSCFERLMAPQGVALPILNLAAWVNVSNGSICEARIAVGPGGPVPWLAPQTAKALIGQRICEATLEHGLETLLGEVDFRSSRRRASSEYRRGVVGDIFRETVSTSLKRASAMDQ